MRPLFWFIILPVLINSLNVNERSDTKETLYTNKHPTEVITSRDAKTLFSFLSQYAEDIKKKAAIVTRRQDTADAITVSKTSWQ